MTDTLPELLLSRTVEHQSRPEQEKALRETYTRNMRKLRPTQITQKGSCGQHDQELEAAANTAATRLLPWKQRPTQFAKRKLATKESH